MLFGKAISSIWLKMKKMYSCFSTVITKINDNETTYLRSCTWTTNLLIWSHMRDQCRRLYVNRTVVQTFKNFVYKLQRYSYSLISYRKFCKTSKNKVLKTRFPMLRIELGPWPWKRQILSTTSHGNICIAGISIE